MVQIFINKHFFNLLIFTLTFGILLYDAIGFNYTDEVCALFLFVLFGFYMIKNSEWPFNKAFFTTIIVFVAYFLYSVFINSNTKSAIISDCLIQIKPYLAFFCVYSMAPFFSVNQNFILRVISIFFGFFLLIVGCMNPFERTIRAVMGHESYFAAAVVSSALCYLIASDFRTKDKIIYLMLLSVGLFSTRSKFYGFFILNCTALVYFNKVGRFHLTGKSITLFMLVFALIIAAVWQKINLYFIQGLDPNSEKDLIARFVLYATSFEIFRDYFPFGSGFASFATFSSGEYYSDIYVKYGIENIWGLSKKFHSYVADTYYPSLAQFGIVGVVLYLSFWIYIIKRALLYFQSSQLIKYTLVTMLIIAYFAIESTTDSTYTTHRGFFIMMLLGFSLANMKREALESNNPINPDKYESVAD